MTTFLCYHFRYQDPRNMVSAVYIHLNHSFQHSVSFIMDATGKKLAGIIYQNVNRNIKTQNPGAKLFCLLFYAKVKRLCFDCDTGKFCQ